MELRATTIKRTISPINALRVCDAKMEIRWSLDQSWLQVAHFPHVDAFEWDLFILIIEAGRRFMKTFDFEHVDLGKPWEQVVQEPDPRRNILMPNPAFDVSLALKSITDADEALLKGIPNA
jgi:hypothetical protein